MSSLVQDVRFAIRTLARQPGFAALTVGTLALGIGATVAVFSIVWHVLLAPLPFPHPDRLMVIWETHPDIDYPRMVAAPPNVDDWARESRTFESFGISTTTTYTLSEGQRTDAFNSALVSASLMQTLGVAPRLGRSLTPEDERNTALRPVLISERIWREWFGGDDGVIGRVVRLNERDAEIVGVMPASFAFPPPLSFVGLTEERRHDLWVPANHAASRGAHYVMALGRLRAGVTPAQADQELKAIAARLAEIHADNRGWSTQVVPLQEELAGPVRPGIAAAFGAVGFVFLLACANVANLLLARGTRRRKEMAVRAALGAGRLRLLRQLGIEALVITGAGAAVGILLASWAVRIAVVFGPPTVPRLASAQIDARVLLFTVAIAIVGAVATAFLPALVGTGAHPIESLRERIGFGARTGRLQRIVVGGEIALALVLLVAAVVLVAGFIQLRRVDLGYRTDDVVSMRLTLTGARYTDNQTRVATLQELLRRLESLPEISVAGASDSIPLSGSRQGSTLWRMSVPARGHGESGSPAATADGAGVDSRYSFVTPGYFEAVGTPLKSGRLLTATEPTNPATILLNETAARRLFGELDPLGRQVRIGFERTPRTVVGIVGDERHVGPRRVPDANAYIPAFQYGWTSRLTIAARVHGSPDAALSRLREVVREVDPALAPYDVQTMHAMAMRVLSTDRFLMLLLLTFAAVALALAVVGVYGTTSYYVAQQTHDFGIRLALGARGADIAALVLRRIAVVAVGGAAGGLLLLVLLRPVLSRLMPEATNVGVGPALTAALSLALLALFAAGVPARRAMRTDPLVALRQL